MNCAAKTKRGTACGRNAGWGTGHPGTGRCKLHGGSTPTHELAGALHLARREAAAMGRPLERADPHEAILECIRIAAGEVFYCSERIDELKSADEAAGPVVTKHERPMKGDYGVDLYETVVETRSGPPALNVWVRARHEAMDRLVNYSKVALAAGVEERKVRIAEGMAEQIADAMKAFATAMGLNVADPHVRKAMRKGLLTIVPGGHEVGETL
jgi:hypothetical protein